jgi:hypothetical protein
LAAPRTFTITIPTICSMAAGSMSPRRKVFGRGDCQPGLCHRLRMDVRARAQIRCGPGCTHGLVIVAC